MKKIKVSLFLLLSSIFVCATAKAACDIDWVKQINLSPPNMIKIKFDAGSCQTIIPGNLFVFFQLYEKRISGWVLIGTDSYGGEERNNIYLIPDFSNMKRNREYRLNMLVGNALIDQAFFETDAI